MPETIDQSLPAHPAMDTSLVRSVAVLAIVNSHMEAYYPRSEAAIGGLIGLALFFMAAGIGLNCSHRTREHSFLPWYWRRIVRIHPSVMVAALLVQLALFGAWRHWTAWDYLDNLLYPLSQYQFLTKIFVYYGPLYYYIRWDSPRKHVWGLSGSVLLCLATAWPDVVRLQGTTRPLATGQLNQPFLWSVFFLTVMLGVWISDAPQRFTRYRRLPLLLSIAATGLVYLGTKYTMAKLGVFTEGFLLLYASGVVLAVLLVALLTASQLVRACHMSKWPVRWTTIGLGSISLEVYLVHTRVYSNHVGNEFSFPLNVAVFALVSLVLAVIVHQLANLIRAYLV